MKKVETPKNYDDYRNTQIHRSAKKWNSISFEPALLHDRLDECTEYLKGVETICCMGIRGGQYNEGNEMVLFRHRREFINSSVVGVDICPQVANVIGKTFCHDFNKLPDKGWENRFDLIYSNSLDHAYDVSETLKGWAKALKPRGHLLLDLSKAANIGGGDIYQFEKADALELAGSAFDLVKILETETPDAFSILLRVKK